jgi:hypothetical protein
MLPVSFVLVAVAGKADPIQVTSGTIVLAPKSAFTADAKLADRFPHPAGFRMRCGDGVFLRDAGRTFLK